MLLKQRTLFQQHFAMKYLHKKPIGLILSSFIYDFRRVMLAALDSFSPVSSYHCCIMFYNNTNFLLLLKL